MTVANAGFRGKLNCFKCLYWGKKTSKNQWPKIIPLKKLPKKKQIKSK